MAKTTTASARSGDKPAGRPKTGPAARQADQDVRFLILDVESVADGRLVAEVHYKDRSIKPDLAVSRYRGELAQGKRGSDFIPYTFQVPVAIAVAKVAGNFELLDIKALDEPRYRTSEIVRDFWRGWELYNEPTLVSFNGRGFDLPLLELAAFRYGIGIQGWMNIDDRTFDQHRNRYNLTAHLDLHDFLTNYGSTRFHGGLALAAHLLGHTRRRAKQGAEIQDLYAQGEIEPIVGFAKQDVLDTYFVFLRTNVLLGRITLDQEAELVAKARTWVERRAETDDALATYLEQWEPAQVLPPSGNAKSAKRVAAPPSRDVSPPDAVEAPAAASDRRPGSSQADHPPAARTASDSPEADTPPDDASSTRTMRTARPASGNGRSATRTGKRRDG